MVSPHVQYLRKLRRTFFVIGKEKAASWNVGFLACHKVPTVQMLHM